MVKAIQSKDIKTEVTGTVEKSNCACEAHKKRVQTLIETACTNNAHTSKIQKATSVLMFLAFLLICVVLFQKINR